jgi:cytidylate kinase
MDEAIFRRRFKHPISDAWFALNPVSSHTTDLPKGQYPFITLSRMAGAGGHTLAIAILEEMTRRCQNPLLRGWQIFDQELCRMAVEDEKLSVSFKALLAEKYHNEIEDMIREWVVHESPQYLVHKKIFHCIRTVATIGKAIIVGRGGVCLTRDLPKGIHVRLVASEKSRVTAMMQVLELKDREQARKAMEDQDRDRVKLVKTYFNRDINDPLLFDMIWNTDKVPMATIAGFLVDRVEKAAQPEAG